MKYRDLHSWDVLPEEARQLQNELRSQVIQTDRFGTINTVAGVDIGFKKDIALASVVVLSFPELQVVDSVVTESPVRFPYIPGFLSFREIPPLLTAFTALQTEPDLVIVDGQGIAHPRRFGLASHLGLILDKPTIGCAKSRLWGRYEEPDSEQSAYTYLTDKGEVIGAAVRTRANVRVVYVSIGHRISLDSARVWVLACCQGYRLPETTRYAHNAASGKPPRIHT
ncbi:deoxyribonuclease V [Candidatus Poribacteria bacterium]|nr:deoxyribonuclease V [Candidatus Poribacteria bacterium]MYG06804.1 deoxyribonuclease V [Candidatus Poribacteria bacterium]MYK24994.1 deoxyribonuclease V [Candidatus Poribacteria bacterium]